MAVIKAEDSLWGVRYWSFWRYFFVPKYELYKYQGQDIENKIFYFKSIKTHKLVGFNFLQLQAHMGNKSFIPFVLDFKRIQDYLESKPI